jgi:hypothetical protein
MEKVNLTITSIQNLYQKNLVIIDDHNEPVKEKKTDEANVSYTGGFKGKILWLHTENMHPFLSDDDHEMVSKILDACRLSWDDIALVNIEKTNQPAHDIIDSLAPLFVISSIPSPINNITQPALYQLTESAGIKSISTDTLRAIRTDKNLKIKFWQALKIMFQL